MLIPLRHIAFALVLVAGAAVATPVDVGIVRIDAPAGFEGPLSPQTGSGRTEGSFVKRYPRDARYTSLEVLAIDYTSRFKSMPEPRRVATTDRYLRQYLGAIRNSRTAFESTPTGHVRIGGLIASRATWHGIADGRGSSGTIYCVLAGDLAVKLSTQDDDDAPPENRVAAIRAIESATFNSH